MPNPKPNPNPNPSPSPKPKPNPNPNPNPNPSPDPNPNQVGNTETVVKRDERRGAPSPGFDSVIVPGRPLPPAARHQPSRRSGGYGEDYLLFDGSQAMPLYLVEYTAELMAD